MRKYVFIAILFTVFLHGSTLTAQEVKKSNYFISVGGDIVSSFVWRGTPVSTSLNFQPSFVFSKSGFSAGSWGSVSIDGTYKEIDLFLSYEHSGFTAAVTDFYFDVNNKFFNYKNNTTSHMLEFALSYENEKIPIKILASTFFYGADKKAFYDVNETDFTKNNFSSYFELSYTFKLNGADLNTFAGLTSHNSFYGNTTGFVYTGITASKKIKITENFSLPLFVSFSVNPQVESFFVVFGINL